MKPYIICHMVMSIDGRVTGEFLSKNNHEIYYQINRDYKADAFACGRVTMEESFTGGYYPDLTNYQPVLEFEDYILNKETDLYALAFDPHGRLGWKEDHVIDLDQDPGYDNAKVIEILTHQVDKRYLSYLQKQGILYIFGGEEKIDIKNTLFKLKKYFNINKILLEGGSIINGAFMEENLIDELSLVIEPITGNSNDKPLFMESNITEFTLKEIKKYDNDIIWLNYIKKEK